MTNKWFTRLDHRAVLALGGADCRSFLQGLTSNDVTRLAPDRAQFAAMLTAQGKFLHDLFLFDDGAGGVWLESEAARRDELARKLTLHRLRAKVTIEAAPLVVFAAWGDDAAEALGLDGEAGAAVAFAGGVAAVDPRLAAAGARLLLPEDGAAALAAAGFAPVDFAEWDHFRLGLGLPDGSRDIEIDKGLLLECGHDELHGVDFDKGCYMGQELTARTRYRGLIRKRLLPVTIAGPAPAPGTPILAGETEAGEMRSSRGDRGLALIRLEAFRAGGGAGLTCGEATLTAHQPDWAVLPAEG
ncbi:YgfZ/GcvT domain-containing protein [Phaeospirillum tilakii]|uniref:YgfZ/GcvT domain-containing protein n=1 Tax=Phaeospirillum tilakii TaxID=741673 RepID=A0ABW5CE78_9PROT